MLLEGYCERDPHSLTLPYARRPVSKRTRRGRCEFCGTTAAPVTGELSLSQVATVRDRTRRRALAGRRDARDRHRLARHDHVGALLGTSTPSSVLVGPGGRGRRATEAPRRHPARLPRCVGAARALPAAIPGSPWSWRPATTRCRTPSRGLAVLVERSGTPVSTRPRRWHCCSTAWSAAMRPSPASGSARSSGSPTLSPHSTRARVRDGSRLVHPEPSSRAPRVLLRGRRPARNAPEPLIAAGPAAG